MTYGKQCQPDRKFILLNNYKYIINAEDVTRRTN